MKTRHKLLLSLLAIVMTGIISCGPNDDSGSMDQKNSDKEGAVDSTRIPNFDSAKSSLYQPVQVEKGNRL